MQALFFLYGPLFTWSGFAVPTYPAFAQGFSLLVWLFAIGFAVVAKDPTSNRVIVQLGILGKVCVFTLFWTWWSAGALPLLVALAGTIDFGFAIAFTIFLVRTRRGDHHV